MPMGACLGLDGARHPTMFCACQDQPCTPRMTLGCIRVQNWWCWLSLVHHEHLSHRQQKKRHVRVRLHAVLSKDVHLVHHELMCSVLTIRIRLFLRGHHLYTTILRYILLVIWYSLRLKILVEEMDPEILVGEMDPGRRKYIWFSFKMKFPSEWELVESYGMDLEMKGWSWLLHVQER